MANHGNFVVSLGKVCKWLAEEAEALGVDIYPGFAAAELLLEDGKVTGIATGDMGIEKSGAPGPNFARGMALKGKYVLLAEGVRGSLSKRAIAAFGLAKEADVQKYGIGFKEIWQVTDANHHPGLVQHTLGWPLQDGVGGGSFIYHLEDNQVAVGFVVHLNYKNPYLSPFDEFQRLKTHPAIRGTFEGATRLSYGARAIAEGGYQSIPQ
jgi:electron-transferring-flavoprotein dehydrogenase